jgi:hypothetical protein
MPRSRTSGLCDLLRYFEPKAIGSVRGELVSGNVTYTRFTSALTGTQIRVKKSVGGFTVRPVG